jgi:hypothetical protein
MAAAPTDFQFGGGPSLSAEQVLDLAEQFADGRRTGQDVERAAREFDAGWEEVRAHAPDHSGRIPMTAVFEKEWDFVAACSILDMATSMTRQPDQEQLQRLNCETIRDVVGNPFQVVETDLADLGRSHRSLKRLARAVHEEHRFDRLRKLADALEKAGCREASVLEHCRSDQVHARGCWLVDRILAKQ